jgi:TetR/AcrR family transcriptional repressor of mexCD-oprJ operon
MTMTTMQTTKRTKTKAKTPAQPLRLSSRDAILAAAMTSMLKNPSATIDDVVAAAGVSRATVFRQFPTRTDLVRAVAVSALAGLERSLQEFEHQPGDARQRLQSLLRVLMAHGEQLHFLIVAVELYDDAEVVAASNALDRYLVPVFDDAVAAGILRADVPRAWVWSVVDAVIFAAWHEVQRGTLGREQAVELVEDTLLRGLGVPNSSA